MLPSWLFGFLLGFSLCIAANITLHCCDRPLPYDGSGNLAIFPAIPPRLV